MPNTIIGKIKQIGDTQNLTSRGGNQFTKRELVLDCTTYDQYTGEPRPNYPSFTLMSKHVKDLDNFKEGDRVIVSFFISGNAWKKDGVVRYINDIVAYKIEPYVSNQGPQTSQNSAPSQTPTQGTQSPPQSSNASQQSNTAAPPIPPASGVNTDDLPF